MSSAHHISSESHSEKVLKTQGHFTADLVSLDFKSESLQKFLESVVAIVNQHSYKLNKLESDKLNIEPAVESNLQLSNSISLSNSALLSSISLRKDSPATSDKYHDSTAKLANKLDMYNQSIDLLYKRQDDRDSKFSAIERRLDEFVGREDLRDRLKKSKDEGKAYTDEENGKILSRLKELEIKVNKKLGDFENLTKEVQKKTLWKITECEGILSKKVTAQYVEKSAEQLEQKILRDIKNNKSAEGSDFKFQIESVSKNFETFIKDNEAKSKEVRKQLKQLEEQAKTFEKKEKSDSDKRDIESKLKDQAFKIDRLERRQDPADMDLRLTKILAEHSQKIQDSLKRIKHMEEEFSSLNDMMSNMGGEGGMNDPHKICHLDAEIKRLKDSSRSHEIKIASIEEELKTKLLIFEQRINSSVAMMRNQDNSVSRQELYESVNRLKEPVNDRLNDFQNLINELAAKAQKIQLFEKATKRKIKDITKGDDLNKILEMKMNSSEGKMMIDGLNMKIENVEVYFNKMKMELDGKQIFNSANSAFLREIHEKMGGVEEGFSIISNRQKIFPAKCLACGVKHVPHRAPGEMQGTDGRFYRVDLKNTCMYDQDEVFDVVPSQITLVQTAKREGRISSAKGSNLFDNTERDQFPSTAGLSHTGFRPQSAKKM